jgi:hypothetical protein
MGIFRDESAGLTVTGPCSCGGSLCTRGAALTPRHFFTARASEGGKPGMAWHSTAGHRAYSGSSRAVREAYMNPLISPSLPSFCSPVVQPAASRELLEYSQLFPRARDGHFCLQTTVYLQANSSALQEHSNRPQTGPGTSQHPQQAPADQVEQCIAQHAAASSSGSS